MQPRKATVGRLLCLLCGGFGAFGLVGCLISVDALRTEEFSQINTCIALLLLGLVGAFHAPGVAQRLLGVTAVLVVLVIGAATILEYALSLDFWLDRLLLGPHTADGPYPGRPSPLTAVALTLLSAGILLCIGKSRLKSGDLPGWLILSAAIVALTALLGRLSGMGASYLGLAGAVRSVSVPTAVGLAAVSIGLILQQEEFPLVRILARPGPGGFLLRRFGPLAILVSILLGLYASHALDHSDRIALPLAAVTVLTAALSLVILARTAIHLDDTQRALENARAQSASLVELASDAIFIVDLDGRYQEVNETGCRMLGYTRAELLRMAITDVIPPEDLTRLGAVREKLLNGGTDIAEWSILCKDGRYLPIEVSTKILPDNRWVGFVRDITERKLIEREQKLLSGLAAVLAESLALEDTISNVGQFIADEFADICIIDVVGDGGHLQTRKSTCVYRSQSADMPAFDVEVLRYACLGLAETVCETGRPVLVHTVTPALMRTWTESEESYRALKTMDPKSAIALPMSVHGETIGVLTLICRPDGESRGVRDIRLAEVVAQRMALGLENARLYQAAREATKYREKLLSVVAHELRNHLKSVQLQLPSLHQCDAMCEQVGSIEYAADRMSRLIQDLIDVRRLEAGGLAVRRHRLDTRMILTELASAQAPLVSAASLALHVETGLELPDVWANSNRLLQVFENLIGNAVKFTDPGGRITVRAEARRDETVLFSVTDTGHGIAVADVPHLFDLFWQGQRGAELGAGLGLAIAKGIVEAHGGRIWVESAPGHGTTFFFNIPSLPLQQRLERLGDTARV